MQNISPSNLLMTSLGTFTLSFILLVETGLCEQIDEISPREGESKFSVLFCFDNKFSILTKTSVISSVCLDELSTSELIQSTSFSSIKSIISSSRFFNSSDFSSKVF